MTGHFAERRIIRIRVLLLAAVMGTSSASAETWRITPSLSVVETLTDNVNLAPDGLKRSDSITQIVPGIRIDGTGARLKLNLNYQMNNILYARESSSNTIQHYLSSGATLEAVQNWLFIDANANISQTALSPFGSQPNGTANVNSNRVETRTYGISPYIRGRFSPTTEYHLRYRYTASSAKGISADVAAEEWLGTISGLFPLPLLRWTVEGTHQKTHYDVGRDIETSRIRGILTYQYDPQLRFLASGGYETNNYNPVERQGHAVYGGGFEWAPTVRTQVSGFYEKRPFGNFHNLTAQHRTARTAWRFSDRQDVTSLPSQLATVRAGTAFELLFNALTTQFPDPLLRAQEVERRLQQSGIPPDLLLAGQFFTTSVYRSHSREASVAILGLRNTLTFGANITDTKQITTGAAGAPDDFSASSEIEQRGVTADWANRLTPLTSLNVLASRYNSTAKGTNIESTQTSYRVLLTRPIGPKMSGSLGARYVNFNGPGAADYREKAVTASVNVRF
jgi:uncharacterized protein (PEP-CTERM system associated)